jgi:hypothetical protein
VSRLEDRLREAYQGAAATVTPGTSPDLDDLDIVSTWPARPRGRRPRRVLIPAAAAAAVAAIALLAAVILPLALGQPRPATPAPGTPVYQIVNDDFSIQVRNATSQQLTAQVELGHFFTLGGRSAPQGNLLPLVKPPAEPDGQRPPSGKDLETLAITSVNDLDGGHLYVVELRRENPLRSWLYQFRLNGQGQPSALVPFAPLPTVTGDLRVTFSGNGRVLAYVSDCPAPARGRQCVSVMGIATGQTRSWQIPRGYSFGSWSLDNEGSLLEYGFAPGLENSTRIGVLRTGAPPGNLISRGRTVAQAAKFGRTDTISFSAITPDGRSVYFSTYPRNDGHRSFAQLTGQLRVLDLVTGRTRLVTANAGQPGLITADPSVRYALLQIQGYNAPLKLFRLDLANGQRTELPSDWLGSNGSVIIW